ncbi:hypothetical protein ACFSYH_08820 [Populibacterium corticicola]|uniref:Uncharacterized protein n=1 Tax=Populibacterium corticicola TaxID=1812826 RepID=A0ABW5XHD6_9MICO
MKPNPVDTRCYIEEYANDQGRLSARLLQKNTGKKVDLGFTDAASRHAFLLFLSGAKRHQKDIPGVFDKDDEGDCVIVSGDLDFDAPDEIRYVSNEQLSYYIA